jgi:hypothetical protein
LTVVRLPQSSEASRFLSREHERFWMFHLGF